MTYACRSNAIYELDEQVLQELMKENNYQKGNESCKAKRDMEFNLFIF
jgi:hypothetical protein